MRDKVQTIHNDLPAAAKARILRNLKKGDQTRIAEVLGENADTVRKYLRYRPVAKSVLSRRIWHAANRFLADRERLSNDLGV